MARTDSWQKAYLKKRQRRGDQAPTRYRKLGRKQIAILYRCLVNNTPYDDDLYCQKLHH